MDVNRTSKPELIVTSFLCIVLLIAGIQMFTNVVRLRRAKSMLTDAAITRTTPAFSYETGVDINGVPIIPMPPPFEQKAVVFLLHSSSLAGDLSFWTEVSKSLSTRPDIRLVAYCDDDECARVARSQSRSLPFPVVQYAEVQSGVALIEADSRGDSIVRSEAWLTSKTSNWRSFAKSPTQFSEIVARL